MSLIRAIAALWLLIARKPRYDPRDEQVYALPDDDSHEYLW